MPSDDSRRFRQFQLRQLFSLTAIAALAFAVVAPSFRKLDLEQQLWTAWQTLIVVVATILITVFLVVQRGRIERRAGPSIKRFERRSSRIGSWVVGIALVAGYTASVWVEYGQPLTKLDIIPGSTMQLFFLVNFLVVRVWWKIDPAGIEACENGLIVGGLQFMAWDDINRYSWSGTPARQLNLFLKSRNVLNLTTDRAFIEPLENILSRHIHSGAHAEAAHALTAVAAGENGRSTPSMGARP